MVPFDVVTGRDDMVSQGGSVTTLLGVMNRPFPSSLVPLFQNESKGLFI